MQLHQPLLHRRLLLLGNTCAITTGTIAITAPTGTGFTYGIGGLIMETGTTFSGLCSATYNVTVKEQLGVFLPTRMLP